MSQVVENEEQLDEAIGQTSAEAESTEEKKSKYEMTVYEVMLLISLVCVTLSILLLLIELSSFGNLFSGFPWRTEEVLVK